MHHCLLFCNFIKGLVSHVQYFATYNLNTSTQIQIGEFSAIFNGKIRSGSQMLEISPLNLTSFNVNKSSMYRAVVLSLLFT